MKLKLIYILFLSLFSITISSAQKKEKIKGSKIITISKKNVPLFTSLEISDNLEIFIVKADSTALEVEADDNLHDVIQYDVINSILRIYTTQEITSSKKCSVKVFYNNSLQTIITKDKVVLNALSDLDLNEIAIKSYDKSESILNVKTNKITFQLNDKSSLEANIKTENCIFENNQFTKAKVVLSTTNLDVKLLEKANLKLEGDTQKATLLLNNNSEFDGKRFAVSDMELTTNDNANVSVFVKNNIKINATGKAEIELLGAAKIELETFKNNVSLQKTENK